MPILQSGRWASRWVAHLGCLKGCLDYLNIPITDPWRYSHRRPRYLENPRSLSSMLIWMSSRPSPISWTCPRATGTRTSLSGCFWITRPVLHHS